MTDPAEQTVEGTRVDGVHVLGAISPSRAGEFKSCPLMYRYRTIDKLPEAPSSAAVRGSLVHQVLEDLFDLPAAERTPERAEELVPRAWEKLQAARPEAAELLAQLDQDEEDWLAACRPLLATYFDLEDPRRLEPAERELYVEALLDSKLLLRGVVDRIDIAPDGAIRVVDYKTSSSPGEAYEATALFQMRFYALVLWRTRGVIPAMLRLVYLGNSEILSYVPDEQDLLATQRQVEALWDAIREARRTGEWLPRRSPMCGWCSYKQHCSEFGGEILPLPEQQPAESVDVQPGQGVDEDAAVTLEDRDVVRHHQDGAASSLG
ncbi:RecB family exonuclease [Nocardioides marmoriginsengisoli]|uniref:RecB family exonuclease n=1 Tax=Nocardioides marmoriginsengisoli TaxID=661483 RepID=UPI001FEC6D8E|nr:PD-(D/E)XK nuclease family protein [Nocardioides marmoriginsengisoli]